MMEEMRTVRAKRQKSWIAVMALLLCVPVVRAQDASEQKARSLMAQMVDALGGDAWRNRTEWEFQGRTAAFYKNLPTGDAPFYLFHKVVPGTPGVERVELTKKRDVVQIWTADTGWELTFKGKKALPQEIVVDYFRRQKHSIDEVVRVWLKDPQAIVTYDGPGNVQRRQTDKITVIDSHNDNVTLDLDANTHLPIRRSFRFRNETYKDFDVDDEEYADYHVYDGVQTPISTTRYRNGEMVGQRFLTKISYNQPTREDMFSPDQPYNKKK
jgi:hypothetical protein